MSWRSGKKNVWTHQQCLEQKILEYRAKVIKCQIDACASKDKEENRKEWPWWDKSRIEDEEDCIEEDKVVKLFWVKTRKRGKIATNKDDWERRVEEAAIEREREEEKGYSY